MQKRPGGPLDESHLYEQKIHEASDLRAKAVGFNAPDGKYYELADNVELVQIQKKDGKGRDTFVRVHNVADGEVNLSLSDKFSADELDNKFEEGKDYKDYSLAEWDALTKMKFFPRLFKNITDQEFRKFKPRNEE